MDSAPSSFNVSVESFLSRITPSTKAVLIVHSIGEAADAKSISHEAKRRNIAVIEDCSQAHGALLNGRPVGSYGDVAAFSTMYRKAHVTGGCGGVVWTCYPELNKAIIAHSDRGKPKWERSYDDRNPNTFLVPALNWNLDEISCAIGIASLQRLTDTINNRRAFVASLTDRLRKNSMACMPYPVAGSESPFVFPVIVNSHRLTCSKSDFAQALIAEGIPLNPDYKYVACEWPWLKPFLSDDFNTCNAVDIRNKSICLYLNENYSTKECEDISSAIRKLEYAYGK
jgi:perosamine synthetase